MEPLTRKTGTGVRDGGGYELPARRAYGGRDRAAEARRARDELPEPGAGQASDGGAARCGEDVRNECLDTALASVASMVNTILSLVGGGSPPPQAGRARQGGTAVTAASERDHGR
ncbi:hypothetical protein D9753_34290 [Streptomyces dangxiongensis]|uniref:Uncharacterized protein n=1 Tax=Streptomyces dangxiongensis TaxID=1442032 RepID=A0A3G2JNV6_9ACTN|nr:hypothetical protein D9753_34290 [Streptomyces dangxiongensis]